MCLMTELIKRAAISSYSGKLFCSRKFAIAKNKVFDKIILFRMNNYYEFNYY